MQRINVDHAKAITISARRGDEIISFTPDDFADAKGRVRLANGLVSTIFRSQGVTVDQAFILLNDRCDRHDAYVCTSRSRSKNLLYCSRKTIDAAVRAEPANMAIVSTIRRASSIWRAGYPVRASRPQRWI